MRALWTIILLCLAVPAHSQPKGPSDQERALCRPDAVRFCLFKVGDADALRQCLRDNREKLSAPCRGLLKSRGN